MAKTQCKRVCCSSFCQILQIFKPFFRFTVLVKNYDHHSTIQIFIFLYFIYFLIITSAISRKCSDLLQQCIWYWTSFSLIFFHSFSIFLILIQISILYNKNDSWKVDNQAPWNQVVGEKNKIQLIDFGKKGNSNPNLGLLKASLKQSASGTSTLAVGFCEYHEP